MNQFSGHRFVWYSKRLAANDTVETGAHQAGPYISRDFLFKIFPSLNRPHNENPDLWFPINIHSHNDGRNVRAVWYNNELRGGTRNEARLTNFGGRSSALLDPDNTGALTVFAFEKPAGDDARACHIWVCREPAEEEFVEERIGPVEPGRWVVWSAQHGIAPELIAAESRARANCELDEDEIPPSWLERFPTGAEIIQKAVELRPDLNLDPDRRILRRRDCEYQVFLSVEKAAELPAIRRGFESIDEFVSRAQAILQRRKARSGRSLELHARQIFIEEGLRESEQFVYGAESEPGRKPDFLFPSLEKYRDWAYPMERLRMLAVKTTCKDRWRQVLNEAARIETKHLLTLQEGVSVGQFREMTESGIRLVVPHGLVEKYPAEIRPELTTFGEFLREARNLSPV
jgi:hypothetical protein